ncbi:hypothetical protein NIES4073_66810 [Kalymmatonema gypsitolerans NIES-4073]|nr:hypothetical protein NIES4073_66810 [Scytonema sp. NIES-4073]
MERITVRGGNVPKITLEVPEELSEQLASVGYSPNSGQS